jgi:hypothetical protein
MTDYDRERKQTLDTARDDYMITRLSGRIKGTLAAVFEERNDEIEESVPRFNRAIDEEWPLIHAVATSGAHGWQIVSETEDGEQVDFDDERADPDAPTTLAENAYCDDVSWLVFENGWIHRGRAEWLHAPDVAEAVAEVRRLSRKANERTNEAECEAFEADARISYDEDATGQPMQGWWIFEPTGYVGRPEAVVAHAAGYDAAQGES